MDGRCVPASGHDAGVHQGTDSGPITLDAGPMCVAASECDDADACTTDACASGRCAHDPVTCDDGDACTADACDSVSGCTTSPLGCDDGNACTTDSCDSATGCVHAPVPVAGGTCATPIDVSAGGTFSGDSSCAASDFSGVCSGAAGPDVSFYFDVSELSTVDLDASGSSFTPVLFVGTACTSASLGCDDSGGARLHVELNPGRYFVGLDGRASSDAGAWSLAVAIAPAVRSETVTFPSAGDARVTVYPNLWNAGDYVQGVRATSLARVTSAQMSLQVSPNNLTCDTQDMRLLINGVEVGRFSIPSSTSLVTRTFTFPVISGPSYTLRVETVRTVNSGCGSAGLPDGVSTIVLSG